MISFILRRLAQFLVTLLVASFLLFAVTEFSPGNVASKILGPYAVQSQVDLLYDKLDLGAPLLERYGQWLRSEEHTSELQSLMRISYAVFCLNKKQARLNQ